MSRYGPLKDSPNPWQRGLATRPRLAAAVLIVGSLALPVGVHVGGVLFGPVPGLTLILAGPLYLGLTLWGARRLQNDPFSAHGDHTVLYLPWFKATQGDPSRRPINRRSGVDDVAEVLALPWLPGFKRYPPWILIPMYYAAFFLLWTTLIFGRRGSWGTLVVFVVATISISAVWSVRLRREQVSVGVPVKIAGWREHVRQLGTSNAS